MTPCELCTQPGGEALWQDEFCRVVLVNDASYPGFCRVILNRHIKEMTDLDMADRQRLMNVVFQVEAVLRDIMSPDKINLASLGNMVPHLHWHVIPRFAEDRHFPNPVWGAAMREGHARQVDQQALRQRLNSVLGQPLQQP